MPAVMQREEIFVFVVCGGRDHIDTLHYSLRALRHNSQKKVIVLTDSTRNEIAIEHPHVIDIKTPAQYNHHQASIYLKTGIHKFLPEGNQYCYLDTDIVSVTAHADDIFRHKTGVITFATDHCKVQKFSPHAVNCDCLSRNQEQKAELNDILIRYHIVPDISQAGIVEKQRRLVAKFKVLKQNRFSYFLLSLRFIFTLNKFKLDDDAYYLRWKKIWVDGDGNTLLYNKPQKLISLIEKEMHWRWREATGRWITPSGEDPDELSCDHLTEFIRDKFDIRVTEKNWQHWNGGVFLFDDGSHDFLERWHQKTMAIFEDPKWKTRDQGTLIATVWETGQERAATLPIEFNFLADYHHPAMMYTGDFAFTFDKAPEQKIRPHLLHIYHEWGNMEWDLWRDTDAYVSRISTSEVKVSPAD